MIRCVSEDAVLVSFGDQIEPTLTARIAALCNWMEHHQRQWLVDLVPSYTTLLVVYDPMKAGAHQVCQAIDEGLAQANQSVMDADKRSLGRLHDIPVYYSEESGPDLKPLAESRGLSMESVIALHSDVEYQVFAIGFMPGFGFLGSVDPRLATPRKDTPRSRVPAGSVGIANRQTAVYPKASPGGWQIIGRSPTTMFHPNTLSLLSAGDRVRFQPISRDRFLALGGEL